LATLLVHQRQRSNSLVGIDADQRIVAFLERPTDQQRTFESPWVNSGIAICESAMLDAIPPGVVCDLPAHVYTKLVCGGRLYAYPLTGHRYAVDSPQRLEELRTAAGSGSIALGQEP
jgi:NDP-sugar pyrophosphorylase family protein